MYLELILKTMAIHARTVIPFVIVFAMSALPAHANRINLSEDIAKGWGHGWLKSLEIGFKRHGVSMVDEAGGHPVRFGTKSLRFEVRDGDCGRDSGSNGWSDCKNDRARHELSQTSKLGMKHGQEFWYSWSVFVPEDTPNIFPAKVVLGQFHQSRKGPLFLFQNSDGGLWIDNQSPGEYQTRDIKKVVEKTNLNGRWIDILVHVKWSHASNGFFRLYIDREQRYRFSGQTLAKGSRSYFKFGIYQSFLKRFKNALNESKVPTQVVYYDEIHKGKNAASVDRVGIAELQKILAEEGYYTGTIDGLWGPGTRGATNKFLKAKGKAGISNYTLDLWVQLQNDDAVEITSEQPRFPGTMLQLRKKLSENDASFVKKWQAYLKGIDLYAGPINGRYDANLRTALADCLIEKTCKLPNP